MGFGAGDGPRRVPEHVAVIMDGNGRWAKQRGLPRTAGHRAGAKSVRSVVEESVRHGVGVLTLFVEAGLCRSNGEARRLIRGGGGYINEERIADENRRLGPEDFAAGPAVVRAGKKNRRRVVVS